MNRFLTVSLAPFAGVLLLAGATASAAPEKYQVTGPITEMDAGTVTVMKGKEKFVMARDAATKVIGGGEPKVGDKVTVQYTITATNIEVKPDKAAAKAPKEPAATKAEKPAPPVAPTAPAPTGATPAPAGVR